MNKKQAGIIVTLLVLIVFAGYLASQLNTPIYEANGALEGEPSAISFNESKNTSAFFTEFRITRDQRHAKTAQTLQNIIDNENTPANEKEEASAQYTELALQLDQEMKLESKLKAHGFEDAVCYIEDSKVTVYIKREGELTDKETAQIKDTVLSATNIADITITTKQ